MGGLNIKILLVEDERIHAKLAKRELNNYDQSIIIEHLSSGEECLNWLDKNSDCDLIILDYSLPLKNGLDVLKEIKTRHKFNKPIIMVTGHGDEGIAVEALKIGANDYLIKTEDYLKRLPFLVKDCIERGRLESEKLELQNKLKESEEWYRNIFEASQDAIITLDNQRRIIFCNPAVYELMGYSKKELENQALISIVHDHAQVEKIFHTLEIKGLMTNQEIVIICKNKEKKTTLTSLFYIRNDKGHILGMGCIFKDITLRIQNEEMLKKILNESKQKSEELREMNKVLEGYITGKRMPG